ncbi:hypothetical protein PG987_009172 [Apiospora arundinis]
MKFQNALAPFLIAMATRVSGEITLRFSTTLGCDDNTVAGSFTFHHDQEILFTKHEYRSILVISGPNSTCEWSMSTDGTTGKDMSEVSPSQSVASKQKREDTIVQAVCIPAISRDGNGQSLAVRSIDVHNC